MKQAGRVGSLDNVAQEFFAALPTARQAIYDDAVTVAEVVGERAQYYLKVMKKIIDTSEDYVAKETARYVLAKLVGQMIS